MSKQTTEKAGSGVDKIRRGWATQHWRIPAVREQVQPDRVQWLLPMISLIPEESLAKLTAAFGERFARCSALEVQALVTADVWNTGWTMRGCGRLPADMPPT